MKINSCLRLAWQYLIVALITLTLASCAKQIPNVQYELSGNVILVSGLATSDRRSLTQNPGNVYLQLKGEQLPSGMLLSVKTLDNKLVITPHYSLKQGAEYVLSMPLVGGSNFETIIHTEPEDVSVPELVAFYPNAATIPQNTLRVYLTFSEPIARGQVRKHISLVDDSGKLIISPFLNLEAELWDNSQTRLTLLVDPGRIKQGVGPNVRQGAPLILGKTYKLRINKGLVSAKGVSMKEQQQISFVVGKRQRKKVSPQDWSLHIPPENTQNELIVMFDRLMDVGAAFSQLRISDEFGNSIPGRVEVDSHHWKFSPSVPWTNQSYSLVVNYAVEDVSGNTIFAPFDATAGTMSKERYPTLLHFRPKLQNSKTETFPWSLSDNVSVVVHRITSADLWARLIKRRSRRVNWDSVTQKEEMIARGSVQAISAGSGVWHSELNKHDEWVRFLQIWVIPNSIGGPVRYNHKNFELKDRENTLLHIVGNPDNQEFSPLYINADVNFYASELTSDDAEVTLQLQAGRQVYIYCAEGSVNIEGLPTLNEQDAIEITEPMQLSFTRNKENAHFVVIEMKKD